jgi:hypothetical protein
MVEENHEGLICRSVGAIPNSEYRHLGAGDKAEPSQQTGLELSRLP